MYTNCRSLPLYNFIELNETNDLDYLKEGTNEKISKEDLLEVYHNILEEYSKLIGDKSASIKYGLRAELSYCQQKLDNLMGIYYLLDMDFEFDDDVLKDIKEVCAMYRTEFTKAKLKWSIDGINNRLNRKLKEYENYKPEEGEDEQSFDTYFIAICKEYGQKVNKKETTLSEWCAIVNSVKNK